MSTDAAVASVYAVANALHCDRLSHERLPQVLRTHEEAELLATIRTVSAAAGMALHVECDIADADIASPAHVVAVTGEIDEEHARRIVDAMRKVDRDVAIIIVVPETQRDHALGLLGEAMVSEGLCEQDPELLPRQMVPSALA